MDGAKGMDGMEGKEGGKEGIDAEVPERILCLGRLPQKIAQDY
jgi:hypothetical protein